MAALQRREGELHCFLEWGRRLGNRDISLKKSTILQEAAGDARLAWGHSFGRVPITIFPSDCLPHSF